MAITSDVDESIHLDAVESLVNELHYPHGLVKQIYFGALARLQEDARITDYLVVLTCRKVRDILRHSTWPGASSEPSYHFRPHIGAESFHFEKR